MTHLGKDSPGETPPDAHDTNVPSEAHHSFPQVAWKINSTWIHHKMRPVTTWLTSTLAHLYLTMVQSFAKCRVSHRFTGGLGVSTRFCKNQTKHPKQPCLIKCELSFKLLAKWQILSETFTKWLFENCSTLYPTLSTPLPSFISSV